MTATKSGYRWVILAVSFSVLLTSFAVRLAWGNAATAAGESLHLAATSLGAFVTAFYVGYVIANAIGGFAADRFGPRRAIGYALLPLGGFTFCFGFVGNMHEGLVIQLLMGLSAGVNFSATTKVATAWFPPSERGRAFGLLAASSSIAVLLANSVYPLVIEHYSWETLYRALGIYTVCVAVVCLLALRDAPDAEPAAERTFQPQVKATLLQILRNRDLLMLALAGFGANWGTWGFAFWSNALMVKGHGISPIEAGQIMALFGTGAIVAKPIYGLLSDLIGGQRKFLVILCLASFFAMLLVFGSLNRPETFRFWAPVLGITAFVYSPLMGAMISEIMGRATVGAAAGLTNAFWQCGNAAVPLVVGLVFSLTDSFLAAFVALACGPLFGTVCMMFVREHRYQSSRAP